MALQLANINQDTRSQAASTQDVTVSFQFGTVGDKPIVGNWTKGSGLSSPGTVTANGLTWKERYTNTAGYSNNTLAFKFPAGTTFTAQQQSRFQFLACNFSGNGYSSPAVFADGVWYIRTQNSSGTSDVKLWFGNQGDTPVCGDWIGQGKQTIGFFNNGVWKLKTSINSGNPDITFTYGQAGDIPVVGHWLGGKKDLPGVYRNGTFLLRYSLTPGNPDRSIAYGMAGDQPITGDWVGNGMTSVGVVRGGNLWMLDELGQVVVSPTPTPAPVVTPTPIPTPSPTPTIVPSPTPVPTPSPVPSPSPTPSPVSSVDPSGESMPVGDLPGWHQVFADNFATNVPLGSFPSAVSSKWYAYPSPWLDTSKNGTYSPTKVISQVNGLLNMYIHTENGVHMVSAPEPIIPGAPGKEGGLLYGRYAVRFRADAIPGYKVAWLLWPDSETWPQDGEIDFPEGDLTSTFGAYMHWQGGTSGSSQDAYSTGTTMTGWHTAVIEWLPNSLTFYVDGKVIGHSTSKVPNTPMHWVLQTETQLSGGAPSNTAAGNVQVDWVSVYTPM